MFILDAGNSHHTFPGKVLQDGFLPWRWKRYSQEDLASPLDVSIHQLQPHPSPFLTPSSGTWVIRFFSGTWVIWFLGWEELKSSRCQWWRCWEGFPCLIFFWKLYGLMVWWYDFKLYVFIHRFSILMTMIGEFYILKVPLFPELWERPDSLFSDSTQYGSPVVRLSDDFRLRSCSS